MKNVERRTWSVERQTVLGLLASSFLILASLVLAGCVSRASQPSLLGGMNGGAGAMGMQGGVGAMPTVMPSGGQYSIYGGSALAGTGFDPRAADMIAAYDVQREAARRATVPVVEYVAAATAGRPPLTPPSQGGEHEGYVTHSELRPIVGELTDHRHRIRAVERAR